MQIELSKKPKAQTIEVEVLPPKGKAGEDDALPRLIALVMDGLFRVPGMKKMRFGLNPLLDFVPVLGDGAAAVISALTLFVAVRYRVPKVVMARMGMNIMITALIGIIPGVGEVFAFWFRPSMRNYKMLQKHIETGSNRAPSTHGDWAFVVGLAGVVLLFFGVCVGVGAWVFYMLLHAVFGR